MPTLKRINREAGTSYKYVKELVTDIKRFKAFQESEETSPAFTVEYRNGAIFVDGPYNHDKWYRLFILSDQGNPVQDLNRDWAGWPFEWSKQTLPDSPAPPVPPFKWEIQEENYLSRRYRNRRLLPADYVDTWWKGEIA